VVVCGPGPWFRLWLIVCNVYAIPIVGFPRIAVLGAGPGGLAAAAGLASRDHDVALFNRTRPRLEPILDRGGVAMEGDDVNVFVPLPFVTTDIKEAMANAEVVLMAVPAFAQRPLLELCLPHLRPGSTLVLLSGSAGSLEAADLIRKTKLDWDDVLIGETVTLPLAARMLGPDKIRVKSPYSPRVAAFPGRNIDRLAPALEPLFKLTPRPNVLDPGLNNPNFLIHPGPMLVNYAAVERAEGQLSLMNEGMTPGALRLLDAVDEEKMALQKSLDLEVVPIDDLYRELGSGPEAYRHEGEPYRIVDRIWDRYVTEDVPYGTVLYSSLGRLLDVPTPVSDSLNSVFCVLEETNFWSEGRTLERLGIEGMNREALLHYVETGERY
jgi:opine dehydrogenase